MASVWGTTADLKKKPKPLVVSGCVSSLANLFMEVGEQENGSELD